MRTIRISFIVILAMVLILVATANRTPIQVGMLPESIAKFTGSPWTVTLPTFLALFLAMVFGVLIGLVWEWLREGHLRAESRTRAHNLALLQREVGDLRRTHAAPRDEVLAILDDGAKRKTAPPSANTLPAQR